MDMKDIYTRQRQYDENCSTEHVINFTLASVIRVDN